MSTSSPQTLATRRSAIYRTARHTCEFELREAARRTRLSPLGSALAIASPTENSGFRDLKVSLPLGVAVIVFPSEVVIAEPASRPAPSMPSKPPLSLIHI